MNINLKTMNDTKELMVCLLYYFVGFSAGIICGRFIQFWVKKCKEDSALDKMAYKHLINLRGLLKFAFVKARIDSPEFWYLRNQFEKVNNVINLFNSDIKPGPHSPDYGQEPSKEDHLTNNKS
jgi:hypothetical protein